MERLINRRQQGDLGEASAIEWLTRQGATVFIPFNHSPDYDLIADTDGRLCRVQVKTSVYRESTPNGHLRWSVVICTNGGNQSWTGVTKFFDPAAVDALFVLAGDGRRWFIPAGEVEGRRALRLGGAKYSEFEVERTAEITSHVYEEDGGRPTIGDPTTGERRSGRVGSDCKSDGLCLSEFESHLPHFNLPTAERGTAPHGQTRVSGNRQIVIPKRAFEAAGLALGDRLKAVAAGSGEVLFRRVARESPLV
jgi:PD-(D/E)XK endonuclease